MRIQIQQPYRREDQHGMLTTHARCGGRGIADIGLPEDSPTLGR
ncbi:hypothetical protein ACQV2E_21635 [Pantoea allii]|nr:MULTISPECIES: hypothetical protein [Pantoea]MDJ0037732.1 hypothetical protein [Pantoea allii]MDJ0042451.1 hypothetical protein [Pantoea allii]